MTFREPVDHGAKTLKEGAVCFGCAMAALGVAAIAIQWMLSLLY